MRPAPKTFLARMRDALRSRVTTFEYLEARNDPSADGSLRFLAGLRNANGVWKTTARHRLDDVLPALIRALGSPAEARVLDVGCSSGLSTLELSEALALCGIPAEVIGTDVSLTARLLRDAHGRGMLFLDREHVSQVELEGWALGWPPALSEKLLHPIRVRRARAFMARSLARYREGARGRAAELAPRDVPLTVPVPKGRAVRFVQEAVLEPAIRDRFHAILAANFLNLNYFSADQLRKAVNALRERLVPDGVLCIVRTIENGRNHGTVFRMKGPHPIVLERIGNGSEIEHLVTPPHSAG